MVCFLKITCFCGCKWKAIFRSFLTAMCFCIQAESKTPKQRLLGWIQHKVPDLPITNFSQDWRDGKVLGALVDSCAPGTLCCSRLCRKFTVTNFISKNELHCIGRWHFWVKLELFGMQQACKSGFLTAWVFPLEFNHTGIFNYPVCEIEVKARLHVYV